MQQGRLNANLQVHRQKGRVPVIGNEHRVAVAIGNPTTGHVPHGLQGCLAEQGVPEGLIEALALIDVASFSPVVAGVVNEHEVNTIDEGVKVSNLHILVKYPADQKGCEMVGCTDASAR